VSNICYSTDIQHIAAGIALPLIITALALQSTRMRSLMSATGLLYVTTANQAVGDLSDQELAIVLEPARQTRPGVKQGFVRDFSGHPGAGFALADHNELPGMISQPFGKRPLFCITFLPQRLPAQDEEIVGPAAAHMRVIGARGGAALVAGAAETEADDRDRGRGTAGRERNAAAALRPSRERVGEGFLFAGLRELVGTGVVQILKEARLRGYL